MKDDMTASQRIDEYIADVTDWRGEMLTRIRTLVHEAVPDVQEEWKWDSPVWSQNGMICSASAFRDHVKINFFKGASLEDSQTLFNAGLEAKASRAIDFYKGDEIDESGLKDLIRVAAAYNTSTGKKK